MIKDKEIRDDWLFKEIQRESKISVWNFDEGKTIKEQHEQHCERKANANEHEQIHKKSIALNNESKVAVIVAIMFVFVTAFVIITIFSSIIGDYSELSGLLIIMTFVIIAMLSSIFNGRKK